jgi:hypothetical protein
MQYNYLFSGIRRGSSPDGDPEKAIRAVQVLEVAPIGSNEEEPGRQKEAHRRNSTRIEEANWRDETVLSEYLSEDINNILPAQIVGPDDTFHPGEESLERLTEVAMTRVEPPATPSVPDTFETTPAALQANDHMLQDHDYI